MTLSPRHQDEVNAMLDKHIQYYAMDNVCWRIKWRGKFIRLTSSKSAWKTEAHAKAAMKNQLRREYQLAWQFQQIIQDNPKLRYEPTSENIRVFSDYILSTGEVEFVKVTA